MSYIIKFGKRHFKYYFLKRHISIIMVKPAEFKHHDKYVLFYQEL